MLPLTEPHANKGIHGGRGSGKSHFFAELLVEQCTVIPTRAVCIREIQKSLDASVKQLIEDKIRFFGVSRYFKVKDQWIETPNGGVILFQGMQNHTADSIKSLEGFRIAYAEESQNISQRSLDLLLPTIRVDNSEFWAAWNPDKPTDPIDKMMRGPDVPPDTVCVELNYMDNPRFTQRLRQRMEHDKKRDPDKYLHIWLGKYRKVSGAAVFKNWKIKKVDPPKGTIFRLGADWGFSVDPTVLIVCYTDEETKTLYVWREAYQVGCEIKDTPALFDRIIPDAPQFARKWRIVADSARPETISHLRKHGYPRIVPSRKGAGSVEEGVTFLKDYDIVVDPSCLNTIEELGEYSFKVDKLTQLPTPELGDKKNHVIDALRYAVEDLRKAKAGVF